MRRNKFIFILDNLFWYMIYLLPIIVFIIALSLGQNLTFETLLNSIGFNIVTDNVVLSSLVGVFGSNGVFPVFQTNDLLIYFSYFILVMIIHILIDVLLFIPKFCLSIIDKCDNKARW